MADIEIVKGSMKRFNLNIDLGDDDLDLSTATAIRVCFPGEDEDTPAVATLADGHITIAVASKGKLTGYLPAAQSALLAVGTGQNVQVEVTLSAAPAEPESVILPGILDVLPAIC